MAESVDFIFIVGCHMTSGNLEVIWRYGAENFRIVDIEINALSSLFLNQIK